MKGMLKHKSPLMQFVLLISLALVSIFFIGGLIGTMVMSAITGIKTTELLNPGLDLARPEVITYMRGMQVFQFISLFLIPSLLCARLFSTNSKKYLGFQQPSLPSYYLVGVALLLLAIPLTGFLGELNSRVQFPPGIEEWARRNEEDAAKQVKAMLSQRTIKDLIINLITIAGLAAVGEELLFRGVAQRLLIKLFKNHWAGIIVAAFLFSAMHMQFYGFLPRFGLGILLGLAYWYSGSLWVPILAHFIYDAFLIILVYLNPSSLDDNNVIATSNLAIAASISFLLVAVLVVWMQKRSVTNYQEVYADDAVPVKDHPF
jgi:uncharacterized protein